MLYSNSRKAVKLSLIIFSTSLQMLEPRAFIFSSRKCKKFCSSNLDSRPLTSTTLLNRKDNSFVVGLSISALRTTSSDKKMLVL